MWHKGVRWHHVESDILKERPGTETSWDVIVEHQIPSIKVLFKTNAKSHQHPSIKLLSSESKTQLVNQRKQNSYRRTYIYIFINTELLGGNKGQQEETHHPCTKICMCPFSQIDNDAALFQRMIWLWTDCQPLPEPSHINHKCNCRICFNHYHCVNVSEL